MQLDDWQQEIVDDPSQYILLCKGRQIGGTFTFSAKAVKWMVERKSRILVGSITEEQAKLVIVMVNNMLREKYPNAICKGKDKPTQDCIKLKNGAWIRSRPVGTMGDAFRGFTADVNWFNEGAAWPELAFVSIMPTLMTTGGEMWMDSTPRGKKGSFYDFFTNKTGLWKVYYKSSEDVIFNRPISESWTQESKDRAIRFLNDQKRELSALRYGQEYMGLFLEDLMRFFDEELLMKVKRIKRGEAKGKAYLGCDLARLGGDQISHQIIIDDGTSVFKHAESLTYTKQLTPMTERQIIDVTKLWNAKKVGIDAEAGTLGVAILDHLRESDIKHKVVPINNRKIIIEQKGDKAIYQRMQKEDLYDNLKSMLEHGELALLDDDYVFSSLRSVQFEIVMESGVPSAVRIFSNPHSESHIVEALVRAAWLAKKEKSLKLFCAYT